jgi:hypothetical protein
MIAADAMIPRTGCLRPGMEMGFRNGRTLDKPAPLLA